MNHPSCSTSRATTARLCLVVLTLVGLAGSLLVAQAQSLNVTPPVQNLDAAPGQDVTQTVDVKSASKSGLQLNIYLSDWAFDQSGKIYFKKAGTLSGSACPWITFTPANFLLKPGADLTARYTVQVPADAKPGTHWCALFFDGGSATPPPGKTVATIRLRVGQTIYVNVGPLTKNGAITGMFTQPPKKAGDPYNLVVQYANTGNQVEWVTGSLELRDSQGNQIRKLDLSGFTALPSASRNIAVTIPGPLPAGTYAVLAVLSYGEAQTEVAGQTTFVLDHALPAEPKGGAPGNGQTAPAQPPAGH